MTTIEYRRSDHLQLRHLTRILFVSGAMLVTLLPTGPVQAGSADGTTENWDQWRGPRRDGSVTGKAWPQTFETLSPQWRVELGKGYPGPIVAEDRVFVVETVDDNEVAVRALARADGRELWRQAWEASGTVPFFASRNGDWVRSTPAYDGERLYVGDMEEVLHAFDAATGKRIWQVDLPDRFDTKVPDFGFVSSPLIDDEDLYVQAANSLVKLDRRTGETVWRSLAGSGAIEASGAFSSPVIATLAGRRQLVVQQRHVLHGIDLDGGDVLWSQPIENFRGMMILTPVIHGDSVFTSTYKGRSHFFEVRREEGGFEVEETWSNKAAGYMSSPVLIDGRIYLHLGNGRIDCIELESGLSSWRTSEAFGKYWSMVWQGDKILALDQTGMLYLARANADRFELLDSFQAGPESWGHIAIVGDEIYVRDLEGISAFRWSPSSRSELETAP